MPVQVGIWQGVAFPDEGTLPSLQIGLDDQTQFVKFDSEALYPII